MLIKLSQYFSITQNLSHHLIRRLEQPVGARPQRCPVKYGAVYVQYQQFVARPHAARILSPVLPHQPLQLQGKVRTK